MLWSLWSVCLCVKFWVVGSCSVLRVGNWPTVAWGIASWTLPVRSRAEYGVWPRPWSGLCWCPVFRLCVILLFLMCAWSHWRIDWRVWPWWRNWMVVVMRGPTDRSWPWLWTVRCPAFAWLAEFENCLDFDCVIEWSGRFNLILGLLVDFDLDRDFDEQWKTVTWSFTLTLTCIVKNGVFFCQLNVLLNHLLM